MARDRRAAGDTRPGEPVQDLDPESARRLAATAEFLEGLINFERKPGFRYSRLGLAPIEALLGRIGHPERGLSFLHVAGSKGKGSTCLLAESILQALGERVGVFTSPHLEHWTERFRIGGQEVDADGLADAVDIVRPHVEWLRAHAPGNAPTFFDATFATALVLFAERGVDRAILEVGLGGRLDSTNVVVPAVTCVTSIELEHTDKLGETLAEIAGEKAGILKPGVPCVIGPLPEPALRVVEARAKAVGAPTRHLGEDFFVDSDAAPAPPGAARAIRYREVGGTTIEAGLPLLGAHQVQNAGLAIAMLRALDAHPDAAMSAAVRSGLAGAHLPGRIEVVGEAPRILVDAAHTQASAERLAEVLTPGSADGRVHLVLSISADKDAAGILSVLLPRTHVLWVTRAEPIRSMSPEALAELARAVAPGLRVELSETPAAAIASARAELTARDLLCCAGSVYLAGAARAALV